MSRAIVLLLDSFGIGSSADAANYGDEGADTFGHIVNYCAQQKLPFKIPHLTRYGLRAAAELSRTHSDVSLVSPDVIGKYGYAEEVSLGKDTPSGHWEMMGVPVNFKWGYFPRKIPCFPQSLVDALISQAHLSGVLGNYHASGTQIIDTLGEEHLKTQSPIIYTSADSVFQIAAHEESFGLERLYEVCEVARTLVDEYNICRVIARPFLGKPGHFYRTGNRRDLSMPPPAATLFDKLTAAKGSVIAIGKTADIFAHRGVTLEIKADGHMQLFDATLTALSTAPERSLIFTNFVDFDSAYGHRRDVKGYAEALMSLDARLPELESMLSYDDVVIITADHGCDPTWPGSDHTREHIPVLMFGPNVKPGCIGKRKTFADIGQTIAQHLSISSLNHGTSFL